MPKKAGKVEPVESTKGNKNFLLSNKKESIISICQKRQPKKAVKSSPKYRLKSG